VDEAGGVGRGGGEFGFLVIQTGKAAGEFIFPVAGFGGGETDDQAAGRVLKGV